MVHDRDNNWHSYLTDASEQARNLVSQPGMTPAEIYSRARSFHPSHPRHAILATRFLWSATEAAFISPSRPVDDGMQLASGMEHNVDLGNSLADLGKELARRPETVQRGVAALRTAAMTFTLAWDSAAGSDFRDSEMLEDYKRVVDLQDEAGDREGARLTSRLIIPRLLKFETENKPDEDPFGIREREKVSLLSHLDSPEDPLHTNLYRTLKTEKAQADAAEKVTVSRAIKQIEAGEVAAGFEAVGSLPDKFLFTFRVIEHLGKMVDANQGEQALKLLDQFRASFPDQLSESPHIILALTGLSRVLLRLNQDQLYAEMLTNVIKETEGRGSEIEAQQDAQQAGIQFGIEDEAKERFDIFLDRIPLSIRANAQKGYALAIEYKAQAANKPVIS